MNDIEILLDELAQLRHNAARLAEMKREAVPAEVQQILADIDAEFDPEIARTNTAISSAENEIKELVIENGATVKAAGLQAVYAQGRVSWDTDKLDGYAVAHPEIKQFKTQGKPSVSIRVAK